jgi:threonine synthase
MSYVTGLRCIRCDAEYPVDRMFQGCPKHDGVEVANVSPTYDYEAIGRAFSREAVRDRPPTMWRYREFLPAEEEYIVSIDEGFTPLLDCPTLGEAIGLSNLYVKSEGQNATWSFKDRMASSAVSMGRHFGAEVITASSSGNAGSATGAYAARAGLDCVLFSTQQFPLTMKVHMQAYGSKLIACPTIEDRWRMVKLCVEQLGWYPTAGFNMPMVGCNPYGVEGYKTLAYEIVEQLGWRAPDVVVMPVGGGDAFYGAWKGFKEWHNLGYIDRLPRMFAAEIFGALTNAIAKDLDYVEPVPYGPTVGISAGTYTSSYQSLKVLWESRGAPQRVGDEGMIAMQRALAASEGVFAEMSSVLSVAAAKTLVESGAIDRDAVVVCVLTATGLKDPETTAKQMPEIPLIEPNVDSLGEALARTYGMDIGVEA